MLSVHALRPMSQTPPLTLHWHIRVFFDDGSPSLPLLTYNLNDLTSRIKFGCKNVDLDPLHLMPIARGAISNHFYY
jgi:hypothetical protein